MDKAEEREDERESVNETMRFVRLDRSSVRRVAVLVCSSVKSWAKRAF